ncbi:MAG TPA: class I SAM-dependent methyltransferase [Dehalococcoidia bacterium]|nr:class I SAM-dependent methyltransferase [Dehalococcoidia bacterium]
MADLDAYLSDLYGDDPFAEVYSACEPHREEHGEECGVYPASPQKMRLLRTLVRATGAGRVLEIGGGLGYSALWLADAVASGGRVETIDRSRAHCDLIEAYARNYGLDNNLGAICGEGIDVLASLTGPFDVVHDDGWFGEQPAYYDRMVDLIKPGGLLILANCFLLEQAITGDLTMDWAQFAGPDWAQNVKAYAANLAADPRLDVSFVMRPAWVGLAWKRNG